MISEVFSSKNLNICIKSDTSSILEHINKELKKKMLGYFYWN